MLPTKRRRNWPAIVGWLTAPIAAVCVGMIWIVLGGGFSAMVCIVFFMSLGSALFHYSRIKPIPNMAYRLGEISKGELALTKLVYQGQSAIPILLSALGLPPLQRVSWDGSQARRFAARGLGRLKAVEGVIPLLAILEDPDAMLRACAAQSLGEIADLRAIPMLMVLVCDEATEVRAKARSALHQLGEGKFLDRMDRAMAGDRLAITELNRHPRPVIIAMLIAGAHHGRIGRIGCINLLAELGASEAIPTLRGVARGITVEPRVKQAARAALLRLEPLAGLPRAAEAAVADTSTLPVPAEPTVSRDELPRAVQGQD